MAAEYENTRKFAEAYGGQVIGLGGCTILTVNVEGLMSDDVVRIMRAVLSALEAEFDDK